MSTLYLKRLEERSRTQIMWYESVCCLARHLATEAFIQARARSIVSYNQARG